MKSNSIKAAVVREAARGGWLSIFDSLAPEIGRAILKPGTHIACPVHGGKDGFKLFRNADVSGGGICNTCGAKPDGFSLLMWLRDWSFIDALSAVANDLGLSPEDTKKSIVIRKPVITHSKSPADNERIKLTLRTVWSASKSVHHPSAEPARRYLQSRGLDSLIPDWPSIRFHPSMQYRDDDNQLIGHYPAILALIENGNDPVTIHRLFLSNDGGMAPVASAKKMMEVPLNKSVMGSAIRLGYPRRILGVTEGFETALAVIEATGMVTWPLISSTFMAGFIIPDGVESLIIWSECDLKSFK